MYAVAKLRRYIYCFSYELQCLFANYLIAHHQIQKIQLVVIKLIITNNMQLKLRTLPRTDKSED